MKRVRGAPLPSRRSKAHAPSVPATKGTKVMLLFLTVLVAATPEAVASSSPLERVEAALDALITSDVSDPYGAPLFPPELEVVRLSREADGIHVELSQPLPKGAVDEELVVELRREALLGALSAFEVEGGVRLWVPGEGGLVDALAPPKVPAIPEEDRWPEPPLPPGAIEKDARVTEALPFGGALVGRRIAISAGHGWIVSGSSWGTQRARWAFEGCGSCRGITEDFFTAELVSDFIIPLFQQMGAEVVLVREPDHSTAEEHIIDDGDARYSEEGTWGTGVSPGGFGGDYRTNAPNDLGAATWSFAGLASGPRRVSLRWLHGQNRTPFAVVSIEHAGGVRTLNLDQRLNGQHWLDLGRYWFSPEAAAITIAHGPADGYLIADAVKVGGGMWEPADKPFWQMAAKTYVPWAGAPSSVNELGDVGIRPAYVETIGADAYLSFHANASGVAGGSLANGISSYRFSCLTYSDHSPSASATDCDQPAGSRDLLDEVHQGALSRLRADWDPSFNDRGRLVANFGELRGLDDTPGALIETAFFDNRVTPEGRRMSDNQALHDPRFREAFAYGVAAGLARFLTPGSGPPPTRPEGLYAANQPDGSVLVSWWPTEGAEGYRVYTASEGRAFDEGVLVNSGTSVALSSLTPGRVYALRVAALNSNGESFPSQAVAVRARGPSSEGTPSNTLLVVAYDRRDAWVQVQDNDLSYAVEHGHALGAVPGVYFDGVLDERVEDGSVSLSDYALVDFHAGKDSLEHEAVSKGMQSRLGAFVDGGGKLLISGEEIGYALGGASGDTADRAFLEGVLGALYVADDAETHELRPPAGGPFAGTLAARLDDGTEGVYEVRFPDVLDTAPGAEVALEYPDGTVAGVYTGSVVFFGVPLEAVVPASARAELFKRAIGWLLPGLEEPIPEPEEDAGVPDGGELDAGAPDAGAADDAGRPDQKRDAGGKLEVASVDRVNLPPPPSCGCRASDGASGELAFGLLTIASIWCIRSPRGRRKTC